MRRRIVAVIAVGLVLAVVGCETPRPLPPPPPFPPPQVLGPADIKMLAKAGISDQVIISQIRNARVVYHLSAAEVLELHAAGVSEKVIDFMINTPSLYPPPPPPPQR